MTMYTNYFYGHEVSEYGKQNGYVDYRTLAEAFDAVLSNDIISKTAGIIGEWEQISGGIDYDAIDELREQVEELEDTAADMVDEDKEDTPEYKALADKIDELREEIDELESYDPEIFQYFIVSDSGAEILQEAGEIVFYNDEIGLYVWGVTHYGTAWDYVLTNIKIEREG